LAVESHCLRTHDSLIDSLTHLTPFSSVFVASFVFAVVIIHGSPETFLNVQRYEYFIEVIGHFYEELQLITPGDVGNGKDVECV